MKTTISFLIAMVMVTALFAAQPGVAPSNPAFLEYMENAEKGTLTKTTRDGHTLGYIPSPIRRNPTIGTVKDTPKLPTSYDLRMLNFMTGVRNQGNCGSCWTFATMGSIESIRLVKSEGTWDLSENNMKQNHGFEWGACWGGNADMATAYLSRGDGAILEADDPYTELDQSNWNYNPPVMYMTDACYLPNDIAAIKQAIYDNGAVYSTMYWDDPSYNSSNYTYYYSGSEPLNHCITLAGWDDNKVTSGGTGAWIVKNSWGASWGENGYFYISYNDTQVNTEVCYWPDKINYDPQRVIQNYDYFGETAYFGYGSTNTSYAMVRFSPPVSYTLSKLGTYAFEAGTTIKFEVYGFFDGLMYDALIAETNTHVVDKGGYVTLDLNVPVSVYAGGEFFVKVYYNTPGYTFPIPVEQYVSGYAHANIESNVFWISRDGASGVMWDRMGSDTSWAFDPCVKAYGTIPAAPTDLTTSIEANDFVITWPHVFGAASYSVYCSDEPYGIYNLDMEGMLDIYTPSFRTPMDYRKKFYYIIATNPKSEVSEQIRITKR
jgi:C1A family cysteine protease